MVTLALADLGVDIFASGIWLFAMPGLVLVCCSFQVPLMIIVFLPALDGVKPTWREATTTLGGSRWQYWRLVGGPLLAPTFTSGLLLLFASGLSSYATAAALVSQGSPIVPLGERTLRWARRPLEVVCLLPLAVPPIVTVVGIAPVYAWVSYLLGVSPLTLFFAYVVLALPFAHRALDAGLRGLDVITLVEASRSLGARWPTVLLRVLLPNLRGAVLSAAVITVALVLGELTFASLLSYDTLPVAINLVGKRDAGLSVAASLASLLVAFMLLLAITVAPTLARRPAPPLTPSSTGGDAA